MAASVWVMSVAGLLLVGARTGALRQGESVPRRCHSCAGNATSCEGPDLPAVECPADHLCATSAVAPNYTSSLTCVEVTKPACSLTLADAGLRFQCACTENLCNAPFSDELLNQLKKFNTTFTAGSSDYTEAFYKFANVTESSIMYKAVKVVTGVPEVYPVKSSSHVTTIGPGSTVGSTTVIHSYKISAPRAEALKHEATAPSEDDEDEGEGSGSYEDPRSQRPASAPAAPSSYLPANENRSPYLFANFLVATPILLFFIA